MMILDPTVVCFAMDDDVLDFTLDDGACDSTSSSLDSFKTPQTMSFPEFGEEELEWLSNKDAFPSVDTCFGILADNPQLIMNHKSPISELENSSSSSSNGSVVTVASFTRGGPQVPPKHPVRARSNRRRPPEFKSRDYPWLSHVKVKNVNAKKKRESRLSLPPPPPSMAASGGGMGRRCLHCQSDKTPQWRAGPMGPKTLCNACGVRYKSGRLLPEYRPANSPTYSSVLHSNSHRKVVEMRRQKLGTGGGTEASEGCG